MENHPQVGTILTGPQQRDAIHMAIAPVFAAEDLQPGQHAGLIRGGATDRVTGDTDEHLGIIDPFLKQTVKAGERCFLFLYPGTISSLRHEWTHEKFNRLDKAREWLFFFSQKVCMPVDKILEISRQMLTTGSYSFGMQETVQDQFNEHRSELLTHAAAILDIPVTKKKIDASYFSCAC